MTNKEIHKKHKKINGNYCNPNNGRDGKNLTDDWAKVTCERCHNKKEKFEFFEEIKTPLDLINAIVPEHDRTSCSDDNIENGFYSSTEHTRCSRCTMLQTLKQGKMPKSHTSYLSTTINTKLSKKELEFLQQ